MSMVVTVSVIVAVVSVLVPVAAIFTLVIINAIVDVLTTTITCTKELFQMFKYLNFKLPASISKQGLNLMLMQKQAC
jgi:hypothetical protein